MRKLLISKLQSKVIQYVRSRHECIKVVPLQGMFNFKCFLNSVQYATDHEGYSVIEVIMIDGDNPVLHYVNLKDGVYYDTTLGFLATHYEYYFIKSIPKEEYKYMEFLFGNSKDAWSTQFLKWYHKVLFINRCV